MHRRKKVSWAEAPLWRKFITIILGVIFCSLFIFLGVREVLDYAASGTKICTVDSAKFNSSNGGNRGPSAYRSIHVQSSDCGTIVIRPTRYPDNMNDAALLEFLQAHEGEKFEFVTDYVQFPDALGAQGITSTTPIP